MPIDLSNHKWPVRDEEMRSKPEASELVASARRTFVSEGALYVRAIDFNGQMRAIPRECSAITAMGYDDGIVCGATAGEQSWLFIYTLLSYGEAAVPLLPIPDCTDVRGVVVDGSKAYLAANNGGEGHIVRVTRLCPPGDVIQEWGVVLPEFETLTVPVPGERIIRLVRNRAGDVIYGLTSPGGVLFSFRPDGEELKIIGPVDPVRFFGPVLVEDGDGFLCAFGTVGRMMRYDPATDKIERTGVSVPCFPGRGPYARISSAVFDPSGNRFYVGDTEGLLSVIALEDNKVTTLGKPVPLGGIDHLVRVPDGRIYGVAGGLDGMSHLFVHDPNAGSQRDLGVCCATVEKGWYGYRFGAMLANEEGRIVLGEDDHLGCLFSYFPPMR